MNTHVFLLVVAVVVVAPDAEAQEYLEAFEERNGMTFQEALSNFCPRWDDPGAFEVQALLFIPVIELESQYKSSFVGEEFPTFLDGVEEELWLDVDFYRPIFKPRKAYYPSKRFRPPRWECVRLAGSEKGFSFKLLGREISTGLNHDERAAASRITGRPFSNKHYQEGALALAYGW